MFQPGPSLTGFKVWAGEAGAALVGLSINTKSNILNIFLIIIPCTQAKNCEDWLGIA